MGNPIVDISRDRHNSEKAVFFFEKTEKFFKDWKYLREQETK